MHCGGYEKKVTLTDFNRTGRWMASAGGARAMVWAFSDSPSGSVPTMTVGHNRGVTCQGWQPDGRELFATGSKDGEVMCYDVEKIAARGEPNICAPVAAAPPPSDGDEVTALEWAPAGRFIVGHVSGRVECWQLPEEEDSSSSSSGSEEEEEG